MTGRSEHLNLRRVYDPLPAKNARLVARLVRSQYEARCASTPSLRASLRA